jgi:hypothetical protein
MVGVLGPLPRRAVVGRPERHVVEHPDDYGTSLDLSAPGRNHAVMLAAALTVWILFSVWLIVPLLRLPRSLAKVAAALLWAELTALLIWSYGSEGCDERTCAPLAPAAGIAARTDVPVLAGAFLVITGVQFARRARDGDAYDRRHGRHAAPSHAGERARDL